MGNDGQKLQHICYTFCNALIELNEVSGERKRKKGKERGEGERRRGKVGLREKTKKGKERKKRVHDKLHRW